MTRYRSYDWENEIDPVMSIECLNPTGLKKRLTPEEILERIDHMAWMPVRATKLFYAMQNQVKQNVGVNVFEPVRMGGALSKQIYLPAVFEFEDDEALVAGDRSSQDTALLELSARTTRISTWPSMSIACQAPMDISPISVPMASSGP